MESTQNPGDGTLVSQSQRHSEHLEGSHQRLATNKLANAGSGLSGSVVENSADLFVRQRTSMSPRSDPITNTPTSGYSGAGDFQFIMGSQIDHPKNKKAMAEVRKRAMRHFLTTEEMKVKRPRTVTQQSERSMTEYSTATESRSEARLTSQISGKIRTHKGTNLGQLTSLQRSIKITDSAQQEEPKIPIALALDLFPLVVPVFLGQQSPYQSADIPSLVALGEAINPFGTRFQSRSDIVSIPRLKSVCRLKYPRGKFCAEHQQMNGFLLHMQCLYTGILPCYPALIP